MGVKLAPWLIVALVAILALVAAFAVSGAGGRSMAAARLPLGGAKPALDEDQPSHTETATFALG